MKINQLKVEDLEKIYVTIYENACELLEESELLFIHEKYARSYLCSHIAFEELGKLPMLYLATLDVYNGIEVDWKSLNSHIRDHKSKISMSYTTVMEIIKALDLLKSNQEGSQLSEEVGSLDEQDCSELIKDFKDFFDKEFIEIYKIIKVSNDFETTIKQYIRKQSLVQLLNEYKNGSLYADYDDGVFKKPSQRIDKGTSFYGLVIAWTQKKFLEIKGTHLYKYPEGYLSDLADRYKEFKE